MIDMKLEPQVEAAIHRAVKVATQAYELGLANQESLKAIRERLDSSDDSDEQDNDDKPKGRKGKKPKIESWFTVSICLFCIWYFLIYQFDLFVI